MTTPNLVDISGLSKAEVLAALFNASSPGGMGFLQAGNGPQVMTVEYAEQLIQNGGSPDPGYPRGGLDYDYLYGRPLKVNLENDEFDPWGFDRDNGGDGAAQRIIDALRSNAWPNNDTIEASHQQNSEERLVSSLAMALGAEVSVSGPLMLAILGETKRSEISEDDLPSPPVCRTPRQYLDWASDTALQHFATDPQKSIAVFLTLVSRDERTAWIATSTLTGFLLADGLSGRDRMSYMMKGFAA